MRNIDVRGARFLGHPDPAYYPPDDPNTPDVFSADRHKFQTSISTTAQAAHQSAASTQGSGISGALSVVNAALASPFVINVIWDSSVASAPSGFTAGVMAAVQYLESQFTDPVTININVGYGEVGGGSVGSLGASQSNLISISYSQLLSALASNAKTASDTTAVASLPVSDPVNGTYWLTYAQAQALGVMPAVSGTIDGSVGFSSSLPFTYANNGTIAPGTYDFNGIFLHEITEVMGRMLFNNTTIGSTANSYDTMDLFHYASPGVRDFSGSTAGYFSIDGGVTNLGNFNTVAGGDTGDWAASVANNAFDAFSFSGVTTAVTTADLTLLDSLGWDRAAVGGAVSSPTGVAISPVTASLAGVQSGGGLAARSALASIAQIGGAAGDSYSYALGGANAAAFSLPNSGNVATLSTGASSVAGAPNGVLYGLTVTATDVTSGGAGPAVALGVVAGSGGNDTIQLSALAGASALSTPMFIYGLAGADTINGAGMTGKLWLDGGAGGDVMTGGSGANDYVYASTSDSMRSAMDIITNFHTAGDVIDLSGLGTTLKYAGKLSFGSLSGHSIGWQVSGGNTFVYANTSSLTERLSAANMKIELQGSLSLSSGNIAHV